jgi:membrane-bound ClpP family serine protease
MNYSEFCEWAGALLGMLGAFLLATNTRVSRYGWIAFLFANFAMIGFAWSIDANALLLQQVVFTATSLLGIYRTGLLKFSVRFEICAKKAT